MKKPIDINKRTLEQEKQYLKQTSGIIRIEAVCFGICLMLLMIRELITIYNAEGASALFIIKLACLPFEGAAAFAVANFVTRLFREIENGETPFRYSVADKMKGLSDAVMACGIVFALPHFVIQIMSLFSEVPDSSSNAAGVIVLGGIFLGLVFRALSYIFSHGCRLQQESDETL